MCLQVPRQQSFYSQSQGAGGRGAAFKSGAAPLSAASPCKITLSNSGVHPGRGLSPPLPSPGHASAAGRARFLQHFPIPLHSGRVLENLRCHLGAKMDPQVADFAKTMDFDPSRMRLGPDIVKHSFQDPLQDPPRPQKVSKTLRKTILFTVPPMCQNASKMVPKTHPKPAQNLPS